MLREFNFETHPYGRYFGKRYLPVDDFIRLCDLVGLRSCLRDELESYEKQKLMFPVARIVMPDEYAIAYWIRGLGLDSNFKVDNRFRAFQELFWFSNNQNSNQYNQDLRHPIDKSWGLVEIEKPYEEEFIPWDNYSINFKFGNNQYRKETASHFYHYWQIYQLYDVRKHYKKMYRDNTPIFRFGNLNQVNEMPFYFEPLSYFSTLYSAMNSKFFEGMQPDIDGFLLLNESQRTSFISRIKKFAVETRELYKLDDDTLYKGLRKMMEFHYFYEEAERYKLSLAIKKDIWLFTEFINFSIGEIPEDISKKIGPVGTYLGNYLEILFPNRKKAARQEAFRVIKHLLQVYSKLYIDINLTDDDLNKLLDYTEATNISWIEYLIVELNKSYFDLHSLHGTIIFIHIKSLSTFPEALMKSLIQNKGDMETNKRLSPERNPRIRDFIKVLFKKDYPAVVEIYNKLEHQTAKNSKEFVEKLTSLSTKLNSNPSFDEFIALNFSLSILLRNFSNHLSLDDPNLLQGQYTYCLRSILVTTSFVWKIAKIKGWV